MSLSDDSDAKTSTHQNFQKNTQPVVNTYSPGRRNVNYYRLSYRAGTKMKHIHIPGGNADSKLIGFRVRKIQGMIERGITLSKIITLINSYKGNSKI